MNRPAVVVGLMVLVGICLVGLGFEIGRSHDTTSTSTTTHVPQSHAGAKWWDGVRSQVEGINRTETIAFSQWDVFCTPGFSQSDCSKALPYLTSLNSACTSFNPGTSGATKQEVYAMNQLEGACDVTWLSPTSLGESEFASVLLLTANLESIGNSS
jgi:hypothetical protein